MCGKPLSLLNNCTFAFTVDQPILPSSKRDDFALVSHPPLWRSEMIQDWFLCVFETLHEHVKCEEEDLLSNGFCLFFKGLSLSVLSLSIHLSTTTTLHTQKRDEKAKVGRENRERSFLAANN